MPQPNITSAQWERVEPPPNQDLVLKVTLVDPELRTRAAPLVALVGDLEVLALAVRVGSATGFLAQEPPIGAEVRVGWADDEELIDTGLTYPGLPVA